MWKSALSSLTTNHFLENLKKFSRKKIIELCPNQKKTEDPSPQ